MELGFTSEVARHSPGWTQALEWAERHFDRALLVLGDTSGPLALHTRLWSHLERGVVSGAAVRFSAFPGVMISVLADSAQICDALIEAAHARAGSATLVVHDAQVLSSRFAGAPSLYDPWLDTVVVSSAPAEPVSDVTWLHDRSELVRFYAEQGVHHHHPDLFELGHYHGVREASGALVSAGGLSFALPAAGYAHLGGFVTAPSARRRGHASAILRAVLGTVARAGFQRCGLFADAGDPSLSEFYRARGFHPRGRFRFIALDTR